MPNVPSFFYILLIYYDLCYSYIAIVYPLRPRMSKSTARIAISLIWCASCILAIPCLLYSQTISHRLELGYQLCKCTEKSRK